MQFSFTMPTLSHELCRFKFIASASPPMAIQLWTTTSTVSVSQLKSDISPTNSWLHRPAVLDKIGEGRIKVSKTQPTVVELFALPCKAGNQNYELSMQMVDGKLAFEEVVGNGFVITHGCD